MAFRNCCFKNISFAKKLEIKCTFTVGFFVIRPESGEIFCAPTVAKMHPKPFKNKCLETKRNTKLASPKKNFYNFFCCKKHFFTKKRIFFFLTPSNGCGLPVSSSALPGWCHPLAGSSRLPRRKTSEPASSPKGKNNNCRNYCRRI